MDRDPWQGILGDLTHNWPQYDLRGGEVLGADLIRSDKRVHCEIAEIRLRSSVGPLNLIVKRLVDAEASDGDLETKARQESAHIRTYGALLRGSSFHALESVGDFSRYHAVVTRKVEGSTLKELIVREARPGMVPSRWADVEVRCEEAGRWLNWIHTHSRKRGQWTDQRNALMENVYENLTQSIRLGLSAKLMNPLMNWVREVLTTCGSQKCPVVLTHNDFTPENIMVNGNGIVVLDYQAVDQAAAAYADVALFLTYLETFGKYPFFRARRLESLSRAFMRGYTVQQWFVPEVLKVYQLKAVLVFYKYMTPQGGAKDWMSQFRRIAYGRWIKKWFRRELSIFTRGPHGTC